MADVVLWMVVGEERGKGQRTKGEKGKRGNGEKARVSDLGLRALDKARFCETRGV